MKSSDLRYLVYSVVIIVFMYLSFQVIFEMQKRISETYEGFGSLFAVSALIHVGFGLLLGVDSFLKEWVKDGAWKVRLPKLVAFVLPFFVLTVIPLIAVSGVQFPLATYMPYLFQGTMSSLANVALGYGILSCFYRE